MLTAGQKLIMTHIEALKRQEINEEIVVELEKLLLRQFNEQNKEEERLREDICSLNEQIDSYQADL